MQANGSAQTATTIGWRKEENLRPPPGSPAGQPATPAATPVAARWPAARVAAVEALWGEGYAMPGGSQETLRLVKPLALSPCVTLLLLGGGMGGPARTVSGSSGARVTSYEADPELHAIAAARAGACGPEARTVTVATWDRAQPRLPPCHASHALLLEALRGTHAAPLLESLAAALLPECQIVLTELVADEAPSEADREFAAWCRLEDRLPVLPRGGDVTAALQRLHFDVRVTEDLSDRHIAQTLGGWRDAVHAMSAGPRLSGHTAAAFVTEAELWLLRIRLMRRLGVRLVRWHAIRQ